MWDIHAHTTKYFSDTKLKKKSFYELVFLFWNKDGSSFRMLNFCTNSWAEFKIMIGFYMKLIILIILLEKNIAAVTEPKEVQECR
jgi:hypothetical protein